MDDCTLIHSSSQKIRSIRLDQRKSPQKMLNQLMGPRSRQTWWENLSPLVHKLPVGKKELTLSKNDSNPERADRVIDITYNSSKVRWWLSRTYEEIDWRSWSMGANILVLIWTKSMNYRSKAWLYLLHVSYTNSSVKTRSTVVNDLCWRSTLCFQAP